MPPESAPQLWLLVGGNGSGKSSFHQHFLARYGLPLVNADQIARTFWPEEPERHSYEAALLAEKERFRLIHEQQTFCFETVFSHPSKLDFVAQAKSMGYCIKLFYFHLSTTSLNLARVASRVEGGGHNVPEEKVRGRIPRTLSLTSRAVGLADELHLIDNSSAEVPYRRVAMWQAGAWQSFADPLPPWAISIMEEKA